MLRHRKTCLPGLLVLACIAGCERAIIREADREVYSLIQRRQIDALGETHDARLGDETGLVTGGGDPYALVPHPTDAKLPPSFGPRPATAEPTDDAQVPNPMEGQPEAPAPEDGVGGAADADGAASQDGAGGGAPSDSPSAGVESTNGHLGAGSGMSGSGAPTAVQEAASTTSDATQTPPEPAAPPSADAPRPADAAPPSSDTPPPSGEEPAGQYLRFQPQSPLSLAETISFAMRHARQLQTAKEDLYLAALDLTLERHLWTPQLSSTLSAEFADYGQIRDFDRAMTTVAEVAVRQRLPMGGEVTARMLSTLMRDLGEHITSGETGQFIMDANIPLFRGGGTVAYESRYAAERELIYAVRTYERFRRQFVVQIASTYFDLQQAQASIINAEAAREALALSHQRAQSFQQHDRMAIFEVTRVESSFRAAESNVQDAVEGYESAKDQFKILLGMSVSQPFDVVPQGEDPLSEQIERLLPEVDEEEATAVALRYRLDLVTELDRIDDARRGVTIAKNGLLPDLNLTGSMAIATDPNQKNSMSYNSERTTWRGMVEMTIDDRKTERNAYRESLVNLRRGERNYEEAKENVRADVRRALRRIEQARANREIQNVSVAANVQRYQGAEELNKKGRATNQDLVDAQNELLDARNRLAAAFAQYRAAILEFRLATDTLRIDDDGRLQWDAAGAAESGNPAANGS
ncbi:MAG: TolC family protein [Phycisphaerales bacterium]|nr:TolC family protein [Phycisphaerales bacterium]